MNSRVERDATCIIKLQMFELCIYIIYPVFSLVKRQQDCSGGKHRVGDVFQLSMSVQEDFLEHAGGD